MTGRPIPQAAGWGTTLAAWRSQRLIGPFQQLVLLALVRLGPHCDARSVHGFIEQWTGRETSVTAVHTTLQRLQHRGMTSSWKRPPRCSSGVADVDRAGPRWEYGGTQRYHSATTLGWRALRRTLRAEDSLRPGLPGLGREEERFAQCPRLADVLAAVLAGAARRVSRIGSPKHRTPARRAPRGRVRSRILGAPMHAPRVDVLMPVRCARETLPDAVADVLGQTGVEVRLVAIVDEPAGGDDGTAAWLDEHARGEPRLTVLRGAGAGVGAALDVGLAAVEAEWLAHMEADDRTQPDRLRRQWEALTGAALGPDPCPAPPAAVTCRVAQVGARTPGMARYLGWQNALLTHEQMASERWIEIPALHQTGLYRTEAVRACGGYAPRGPWPADIDFWFRWFEGPATARRTIKLPHELYHWRQHGGQSTRGAPTHTLAALRDAKAHYLARFVRARRRRPVHLLSTGGTLVAWARALQGAGVEVAKRTSWRPGEPLPASVTASRDAGVLLVAAYGRPQVRARLRSALARDGRPPAEPDTLLFTA